MFLIVLAGGVAGLLFLFTRGTGHAAEARLKHRVRQIVVVVLLGAILLPMAAALVVWLAPFVLLVALIYGCLHWFFAVRP